MLNLIYKRYKSRRYRSTTQRTLAGLCCAIVVLSAACKDGGAQDVEVSEKAVSPTCSMWGTLVDDAWLEDLLPVLQDRAKMVLFPAVTSFGSDLRDAVDALLAGDPKDPCFSLQAGPAWGGIFYQPRLPKITDRSHAAVGFMRVVEQVHFVLSERLREIAQERTGDASTADALLTHIRPRESMTQRPHDTTDYVQPYNRYRVTSLPADECRGVNAILLRGPEQVHQIWVAPVGTPIPLQ